MKTILRLIFILPLLALAQPPPPAPTAVALNVNKTTGAISNNVFNAATFASANGLATTSGSVASITGTANQVLANGTSASAQTGAVTLTLPQSIGTGSSVTFANVTDSALTSGRVTFAGASGLLSDASTLTFNSGTGILTATGFAGALNGTVGATTPASGAFTTLSTTGALTYGGVTLSNSVQGTGSMVLATSPTLTTPNIGAATGTSLVLAGTSPSTSTTSGTITSAGGIGISNTTDATSATNGGTFTSAGGGAFAKKLYVGGGIIATTGSTIEANYSGNNMAFAAYGTTPKSGVFTESNTGFVLFADFATATKGIKIDVVNGGLVTSGGGITISPQTAPVSPASGWIIYTDSGDGNKLKAKASTGTVVTLGTP